MLLGIYKLPRSFDLCVCGSALVMPLKAGIQMLSRSHVVGAILFALEDIDEVGHNKKGLSRRFLNVTDLFDLMAGTTMARP